MHYKNGREAKNGDKVVVLPAGTYVAPVVGILYDAVAGNDYCNGKVAPLAGSVSVNLKEALHIDDVTQALAGDVPSALVPVAPRE
jgi:hypothetical protein